MKRCLLQIRRQSIWRLTEWMLEIRLFTRAARIKSQFQYQPDRLTKLSPGFMWCGVVVKKGISKCSFRHPNLYIFFPTPQLYSKTLKRGIQFILLYQRGKYQSLHRYIFGKQTNYNGWILSLRIPFRFMNSLWCCQYTSKLSIGGSNFTACSLP